MRKVVIPYCEFDDAPIRSDSIYLFVDLSDDEKIFIVTESKNFLSDKSEAAMPACFCCLRHAVRTRGEYPLAKFIIKVERARKDFEVTNCWSNVGDILDPDFWRKVRLAVVNF